MSKLEKDFVEYDSSLEKTKTIYSGLLGIALGGTRKVKHDTRNGYVYVRLRDNLSEVILSFNDKVPPVYNFPVIIQRRVNGWVVLGRDTDRYKDWGTSAPFLPEHGDQHSFNRDGSGGGDVVFVYPDQMMPLLCYPSGTLGSGNILVAPYMLQQDDNFLWVGNTGTQNILGYKPTGTQAIMGLVILDTVSGNPQLLINSGTPFSASLTGSSEIYPYIPYPTTISQEPLYAVRLVSGTTSITWPNLYNARQFIGGRWSPQGGTGSVGGGGIGGIIAQNEGTFLGTGTTFNFVGSHVDASISGSVVRVFVTGSVGWESPLTLPGILTPPTIAGTEHNYNPTGSSGATVFRLSTDGSSYTISGLAGGTDGRLVILENIHTGTMGASIRLSHENSSSTNINRFSLTPYSTYIDIAESSSVILRYDGILSRWKLESPASLVIEDVVVGDVAGLSPYVLQSLGTRAELMSVGTNSSPRIFSPVAGDKFGYYSTVTGGWAHILWSDFLSTFSTGSASLPSFITGSIPYAGSNGNLKEDNPRFHWDETNGALWIGDTPQFNFQNPQLPLVMLPTGANVSVGQTVVVYGTGSSGAPTAIFNGYRSRGTKNSPTPVQKDDAFFSIIGGGYDGATWQNSTRIRSYADQDFITGSALGSRIDFEVTPSGSATRSVISELRGDGFNLKNTGTYNVNGVPHTHSASSSSSVPYSPGSFTIETETAMIFSNHVKLSSTQRATISGTGRLRIT